VAEIVMGFGIVGPESERTPKFTLCLVELALLPKRIAEIVVGFGMVWIESYGPAVVRLGLDHTTERLQRGANITVEIRNRAISGDRPADQIDRRLAVTGRVRDDTEKMQAVGVVGIDLEDLSVKSLGLVEPARLVQPEALLQGPIGVEHRLNAPLDGGRMSSPLDPSPSPVRDGLNASKTLIPIGPRC